MIRATSTRMEEATAYDLKQKIHRRIEQRIGYYAVHKDEINQRLWELDREWDMQRWIDTTASGLSLLGLVFGVTRGRRWFLLPWIVASFLLTNALQGWCPPVQVLRRFGVRTQREIQQERYALKILRGDFQLPGLEGKGDLERVALIMQAVTSR
jgi:hypothetical protein